MSIRASIGLPLVALASLGWTAAGLSQDATAGATQKPGAITRLSTTDGIQFSLIGTKPAHPAPTLFVFAKNAAASLGESRFLQAGTVLLGKGYLCVSVDLPCHGSERRRGEPGELKGWRHRVDAGEDLMAELTGRLMKVLDHLIAEGYADPHRVAACGTSRGGFSAFHFAIADPRVKCVVGYAPVTLLAALREFKGQEDAPLVKQLAITAHASKLAERGVWIVIGDQDERVGTDNAIDLARAISSAAAAHNLPSKVELHVCPSDGHQTPPGVAEASAAWIERMLK